MLEITSQIVIGLVALFHVYVMWLEMFAWTTKGPKTFKNFDMELFPKTKAMAANQGLYNGFLAAGLIWSFFISNPEWYFNVSVFFLSCVAVAGIYGAATADKKIFFVQGLPALIGIGLLLISVETSSTSTIKGTFPEKSSDNIPYAFLINSKGKTISESFPLEANNKTDFSDSLFFSLQFNDESGKNNQLNFFGPSRQAINNKEAFKVSLNQWGVVYSENPRMDNYILLKTTDKHINEVISLALVNIIKHKNQVVQKILLNQS
jgi:putative membrane protein